MFVGRTGSFLTTRPHTYLRLHPPAPAPVAAAATAAAPQETNPTAGKQGPLVPHSMCPPSCPNHNLTSRHYSQEGDDSSWQIKVSRVKIIFVHRPALPAFIDGWQRLGSLFPFSPGAFFLGWQELQSSSESTTCELLHSKNFRLGRPPITPSFQTSGSLQDHLLLL